MPSMLLYVHGFNSSHLSVKAQKITQWCETNRPDIKLEVPSLACYPCDAAKQLEQLVEKNIAKYRIGLLGSSLGGYWSTWLHERYGFRAVVVNPAVKPYALLLNHLGPQENPYTGEKYTLLQRHADELKSFESLSIQYPERIWLLQQMGDEVLDYRDAVMQYRLCKQTVEPEGNHAFVGFDRYCAQIVHFLAL